MVVGYWIEQERGVGIGRTRFGGDRGVDRWGREGKRKNLV